MSNKTVMSNKMWGGRSAKPDAVWRNQSLHRLRPHLYRKDIAAARPMQPCSPSRASFPTRAAFDRFGFRHDSVRNRDRRFKFNLGAEDIHMNVESGWRVDRAAAARLHTERSAQRPGGDPVSAYGSGHASRVDAALRATNLNWPEKAIAMLP